MKTTTAKPLLAFALLLLVSGLFVGVLSAFIYIEPDFLKTKLGFAALRPMHVSLVTGWIIVGASACVMSAIALLKPNSLKPWLVYAQLLCWAIAFTGILYSYFNHDFGGREYWEFNPVWALPIALSWILYLIQFFSIATTIKRWPVYVWMWMSGGLFFLFTFTENYLWLFPYFREHLVTDMTIQWKVNGSLVGSWNQLIYGTSFFLMDRITGDKKVGHSWMAFAMYFLGLFNLMFNWGHHIYTLPTQNYIRYIGYAVSMTEWIFFARILYTWKQSVQTIAKNYYFFPYRFLMASEFWVFINMTQAILMSIPFLNKYTHGTHITVAHAMGTTIGINTMILLSACFLFLDTPCHNYQTSSRKLNTVFWSVQIGLFVFWLSLNLAGIKKGIWQNSAVQISHHNLMQELIPYFTLFIVSGIVLLIGLSTIAITLLYNYFTCSLKITKSTGTLQTKI